MITTPGREDISAPAIGDGFRQRGPKSIGQLFVENEHYKRGIEGKQYRGINTIRISASSVTRTRARA
jgi:hypothetical protein